MTKSLQVASSVLLACAAAYSFADGPLGRADVLALLAGGTRASEVARQVQQHGINFRPTEDFLKLTERVEAENDPDKEELAKALADSRLVGPEATQSAEERKVIEHIVRGAEFAAKVSLAKPEEYQAVEYEFRQALEIEPENPQLHLALGSALAREQKLDLAIAEFRETLRAMPDLSIAHISLGATLAQKGDLNDGLAELREAVRVDPGSSTARTVLARALLENHDSAGAIAELREGLRIRPRDAALHNSLGTVRYETGDVNSAIAEYWQAINLGSKDPEVHEDLAFALRRKGDLDGAIAQLREAVRLAPASYRLHHSLGAALVDDKDLPGAEAEYREAIRLKPDYALSHSELGYVLKKQGNLDAAIAEYHEAVRLDPKLAIAHANLAAALYSKGQHDAADEEVLIAHELAPNEPSISAQFERLPQRYKQRATQPADEFRPPTMSLGEPDTTNFLYYLDSQKSSLMPLEAETPTLGAQGGIFRGPKGYVTVIGERSPVRLTERASWEFVIHPSTQLNFRLERFEAKNGSRILSFRKKLEPSKSSDKPGLLEFSSSTYGKSSIKLTVPYALSPGEYGFFVSAMGGGWKMFCFGVDGP